MPFIVPFIPAIAGVAGAAIGADAARKAGHAQQDAANQSNALQLSQYNQQRQDQMPWMQAGNTALQELMSLLQSGQITSKFSGMDPMTEPGYKFGLEQGQKARQNSASARGMTLSGDQMKSLDRYGQDYAGTKYNDAFNRFYTERANTLNPLFQIAGFGPSALNQVGTAGRNYANQAGDTMVGSGDAAAASGIRRGNIYANLFSDLGAQSRRWNWPSSNPGVNLGSGWNDDPMSDPYYMGG
jgi:hypothetical protein